MDFRVTRIKLNIILPSENPIHCDHISQKDFALYAEASAQSLGNLILDKLKHIYFIYITSTT